jgi:hypothetical protein
MIVKDHAETLRVSNKIVFKLIKLLLKETDLSRTKLEDDAVEYIYLLAHITSAFSAYIIKTLEGYGKTYSIPNMNAKELSKWVETITHEYINSYPKEETDKKEEDVYITLPENVYYS